MTSDSSFSFRSLIAPGEGAQLALLRDLTQRQIREHETVKPHRWLYMGEADYLLRSGRAFGGRVLPAQYEDVVGEPTRCHFNALHACHAHPELRYFTGFYLVSGQVGSHSWCVAPDGGVIETTFPTDTAAGTWVVPEPGSPSRTPYMPPEYWAYYGLEFKVAFIDSIIDTFGPWLPVLDPECPYHEQMMSHSYSPDGFTPTPPSP
jgi:hypothetical protein